MNGPKKRNNQGSTIVVVLIAVAFLTILGSILLFTTYTGYQMKMTDRHGKQNFYDAETAMNEIRTGIQQVTSDAISEAYTRVLVDYNTAVDTTDAFKTYFKDALFDWTDSENQPLLSYGGPLSGDSYDPSVLAGFLSRPGDVTLQAEGPVIANDAMISLKKLTLTYTENGYSTTVSTDICINMPEFTYTLSELVLSAVPDFTVIARNTLTQGTGVLTVDGNAYAGQIRVSGTGTVMHVGVADNFICRSGLTVADGAGFTVQSSSSLWSRSIDLSGGSGSSVELSGDSYIADDLTFSGSNARATLSGRYFGFGNSDSDPDESSSVIINGHGSSLDFTGLRNLMLAGNSFINTSLSGSSNSLAQSNDSILMGESLSVKSNQLAYLVPSKCIGSGYSNPALISGDVPDADTLKGYVNLDYVLWGGQTLGDYIDDIQLVYYPLSATSQMLVYFYMKFDTPARANEYFSDYFTYNKEEIQQYLGIYSDQILLSHTAPRSVSGNLTTYEDDQASLLNASLLVSDSTCARLHTMFDNLCATLSSNLSGDPAHPERSVYEYIVNEDAVAQALATSSSLSFRNAGGREVGIIINGNATLSTLNPDLKIIIATGDITVNRTDFRGLVIAGGNIYLQQNCNADHAGVSDALQATCDLIGDDGEPLSLLDFLKISTQGTGSTASTAAINWDMEKLVTYDNWTKN